MENENTLLKSYTVEGAAARKAAGVKLSGGWRGKPLILIPAKKGN